MLEVATAIIENELGQILIAKRKKGKAQEGLWEFPGGKIENNLWGYKFASADIKFGQFTQ